MKFFILSALLAVAAASAIPYGANSYGAAPHEVKEQHQYPTIMKQEDVRNMDGSSKHSYETSDMATRQESQYQKQIGSATGNAAQGSYSWVAADGTVYTTNWVADENGYRATGDHLPVAPAVPAEIAAMLPTLPKLSFEELYGKPAAAAQPAYQAPKYDASMYDAPKYEAPKVAEPKYEAPKYDAPRYQAPAVPAPVAPAPAPAKPTYMRY